jgi:hypothetical protein
MKPVLVLTVYRRYAELARALDRLDQLAPELGGRPDVVVVWARPEVARLWFFNELVAAGRVTKLITRPALPGEAAELPTTYPESHNIRLGLEWVRDHYDPASHYAVVQAADVMPNPGTAYGFIHTHMTGGAGAVVFHWQNGCVPVEIWHTNFFSVRLDEVYWPPVAEAGHPDVLEAIWGRHLCTLQPPHVEKSHNYNSKRFRHEHLSEQLPPWPVRAQESGCSAPMSMKGRLPWWRRLLEFLRLARPFRRPPG